jgi:hypothetical protein
LKPTAASAFEPVLGFNSSYIKEQKVKSIVFDIIDKKDFQVAEDKNLVNYYEFNTSGLLTRFYYTTISKTIEKEYHTQPVYRRHRLVSKGHSYTKNEYVYDTISTVYIYDSTENLVLKRFNDGTYYESRYYSYDSKKRLTKERRIKETNQGPDKSTFILGTQTLISEDSFQYVDISGIQYKQICLNNENRPYKEIIINLDEKGNLKLKDERYTVAWIVQTHEYTYQDSILVAAKFKGNANGDIVLKTTYEYDSLGCIYSEKQYKNEVFIKEISYITDSKNKSLNSFISRDPINKTMRIVKLIYSYY